MSEKLIPQESVVTQDEVTFTVTDKNGRKITIRELDLLEQTDLSSVVGADDAQNLGVLINASTAASVREIDGYEFAFPANRLQLRAAIKRLGNWGMVAVMEELKKRREAEAGEVAAAAKN